MVSHSPAKLLKLRTFLHFHNIGKRMLRRSLTTGLGLLVALLAVSLHAADEYWVTVGSYRTMASAEEARSQASERLPESFGVAEAELDSGLWYRVLAGPYLTREIADHIRDEAVRNGFDNAWVLAMAPSVLAVPPVSSYSDDEYEVDDYSFDSTLDEPADSESFESNSSRYSMPSSEPADIPGFNAPVREERDKEHKLITEPPEDYRLHELNRDQAALDWESPFLLASNEAHVIAAALAAQADSGALNDPLADSMLPPITVDIAADSPLVLQQWDHKQAGVKIDGKLDETAWRQAMVIQQLKVTEPDTLATPRYATEVRLFYTERGVYVSFDMEQPAETLVRRLSSRDNREVKRDYVSFTLDTSGSARYAYWMTLALGDTQMDGTALPERQFSSNWDGAWWGATAETERGWSAEFFVPWSQMTMPKQETDGRRRMGFYGAREVAHLGERWAWPALPRSQPKFMSSFHALELANVNPRQQWSLFPYASTTSDMITEDTDFKAGLDVFWRPSTNTQLTATVNPDFGTVEADEVIVNLTAFETFFPEKRLFFLEGREIFEATPRTRSWEPVTLLNTRRIGGSPRISEADEDESIPDRESGQPTELYGAGKVTGQMGSVRYGIMAASEQDTALENEAGDSLDAYGRDFAVARVLYENNNGGAYRALGAMGTFTTHPDEDAATAGLDYHYLSGSGAWKLDGQFLYSDLDLEGAGAGGFMDLEYAPRQGMKYKFGYTHLDRGLDLNDAGFLRRNNLTGGRVGTEWIKSGFERFRDFRIETFLRYEENLDGYAIRSGLGGEGQFTLNNLHTIELGLKYFPARYDDRNSFGNGTYQINERPSVEIAYNTDRAKAFSGWAFTRWEGDGVDGQKLESGLGVSWRPIDRLSLQVGTKYQVREGWLLHSVDRFMTAFDAEEWQPELKMDFFLSARQELRLKLQWVGIKAFEDRYYEIPEVPGDLQEIEKPTEASEDFSISSMNFQVRYRWQVAPLSDVFLVYTKNGYDQTTNESFGRMFQTAWEDPLGEQLVLKVRYRVGT